MLSVEDRDHGELERDPVGGGSRYQSSVDSYRGKWDPNVASFDFSEDLETQVLC